MFDNPALKEWVRPQVDVKGQTVLCFCNINHILWFLSFLSTTRFIYPAVIHTEKLHVPSYDSCDRDLKQWAFVVWDGTTEPLLLSVGMRNLAGSCVHTGQHMTLHRTALWTEASVITYQTNFRFSQRRETWKHYLILLGFVREVTQAVGGEVSMGGWRTPCSKVRGVRISEAKHEFKWKNVFSKRKIKKRKKEELEESQKIKAELEDMAFIPVTWWKIKCKRPN